MPKVFEKPSAARGVDDIVDFLFHRSPTIAQRFFASVWETYEWLSRVPVRWFKSRRIITHYLSWHAFQPGEEVQELSDLLPSYP